jgi:hypothetical protein
LAERLDAEISPSVPWQVIADLFGILVWTTSDNGTALFRTAEDWLRQADDLRRVRVALHLDAYPFLDKAEMEQVLTQAAARHHEVVERCHELIASRQQLDEKPA